MSDKPSAMVFPTKPEEIIYFDRHYFLELQGIISGFDEGILKIETKCKESWVTKVSSNYQQQFEDGRFKCELPMMFSEPTNPSFPMTAYFFVTVCILVNGQWMELCRTMLSVKCHVPETKATELTKEHVEKYAQALTEIQTLNTELAQQKKTVAATKGSIDQEKDLLENLKQQLMEVEKSIEEKKMELVEQEKELEHIEDNINIKQTDLTETTCYHLQQLAILAGIGEVEKTSSDEEEDDNSSC